MGEVKRDGINNANTSVATVQDERINHDKFALLNRLITRDINSERRQPLFSLFSRDDIQKFLSNPYSYEKQLRKAINYIYGASTHFRRLIKYFVGLSDLSYIVEPYRIDPRKSSSRIINNNYRKVLSMLSSMSIKTQIPKVMTVALRDDVFYGTFWVTSDSITIQQLPSDYCAISSIEGNVLNVTFDFSYFDSNHDMLQYYPAEFEDKYENIYKKNAAIRWIELDSPTSFAVKCSTEALHYALPPFAGILREIYDIEDYKQLKLTRTDIENYAMLVMNLPMDKDGNWGIDYDKAKEFWQNLDAVLPDEVGSVLSPMGVTKIGFEKSNTGDTDTVAEAEDNLFTAAGVSSLLFNNSKASANALLLSIKADQAVTYELVKNIGDVINRLIQDQPYGKNFRIEFLDCSPFNRKELGDAYLKAASYGLPTISMYAASQGLGQAELDSMSYLENDVLGLHEMFMPLINSAQMSPDDNGDDSGNPGARRKDIEDLTDSGDTSREYE